MFIFNCVKETFFLVISLFSDVVEYATNKVNGYSYLYFYMKKTVLLHGI